jgi:hypothetical protein
LFELPLPATVAQALCAQMIQLNQIIVKLERFVEGQDISLRSANEIEGDLTEIFDDDDDDIIDDFLHDLAFYRPGGGEFLFDYEAFLPKAKFALSHLRHLNEKTDT